MEKGESSSMPCATTENSDVVIFLYEKKRKTLRRVHYPFFPIIESVALVRAHLYSSVKGKQVLRKVAFQISAHLNLYQY